MRLRLILRRLFSRVESLMGMFWLWELVWGWRDTLSKSFNHSRLSRRFDSNIPIHTWLLSHWTLLPGIDNVPQSANHTRKIEWHLHDPTSCFIHHDQPLSRHRDRNTNADNIGNYQQTPQVIHTRKTSRLNQPYSTKRPLNLVSPPKKDAY
jgi:hypothetical protein